MEQGHPCRMERQDINKLAVTLLMGFADHLVKQRKNSNMEPLQLLTDQYINSAFLVFVYFWRCSFWDLKETSHIISEFQKQWMNLTRKLACLVISEQTRVLLTCAVVIHVYFGIYCVTIGNKYIYIQRRGDLDEMKKVFSRC